MILFLPDYFHFHRGDGKILSGLLALLACMAKSADQSETNGQPTDMGTTMVELAQRPDGTWEATQAGLDIVGIGDSAARATEDMARQIAESNEEDEL